MGKIIREFETEYDVGDIVIFRKGNNILVGIVEGFYLDDNTIWYNIRISETFVFTYSNGGDIGEFDIIGKITDKELRNNCLSEMGIEIKKDCSSESGKEESECGEWWEMALDDFEDGLGNRELPHCSKCGRGVYKHDAGPFCTFCGSPMKNPINT